MKRILKTLRRTLYDDDVSKNQKSVKPQAEEPKSDSREESETAASIPATSSQCQNDIESVKHEAELVTAQDEKEVKADKGQPYFWRRITNNSNCRLFLGGIPDDITEIEVKKVFEKYGKVVDVLIPIDKETKKPKRYGFLEFLHEDSTKACLDDHFVTVNGKRVEVKTAWARSGPKKGEKSWDNETKEMGDGEKFPSSMTDISLVDGMTFERSVESSCTDSESNMGDGQVLYQKLFENYFKAKFFLEHLLGSETISDAASNDKIKKQQYDEKEIEKLLSGLFVSDNEDSSEEEGTGDFSSDFEETQLRDSFQTHSESSVEGLEFYSVCDSVRPTQQNQTEAPSLPMKNGEKIACDICEWAPLNNSSEGFLAHCRTLAHKQKLKERFKKKETSDDPQNKALTRAKLRKTKQKRKKNPKNPLNESSSKCQENQKSQKNRKLILEEIMSCMEAKTDKCIKCKVCNKTIPHAPDIRVLMANLSHHIQSKGHLAKFTEIEKSLQKPENAQGKKVTGNTVTKEKTTPVEKTQKSSKNAQNNENSPGTTKHRKSVSSNKTKPTVEQLIYKSESAPQLNAARSNTKVKFHCLPCNYFCSQTKTFLVHLKSQSHSAKETQTSLQTSSKSLCDNLTNCSHCSTLLYGELNSIKIHITKCKGQGKRLENWKPK